MIDKSIYHKLEKIELIHHTRLFDILLSEPSFALIDMSIYSSVKISFDDFCFENL